MPAANDKIIVNNRIIANATIAMGISEDMCFKYTEFVYLVPQDNVPAMSVVTQRSCPHSKWQLKWVSKSEMLQQDMKSCTVTVNLIERAVVKVDCGLGVFDIVAHQ